ncbi:acyl-CoA dehydrogenase family protein [Actinosynnema sp. CS-041913]|uniref:acyl-CoA dehydrogenase family protein n=1 Tax=Actinosynnema sp. CS-041913 TaxID=3239917 RepID=UPI003D8E64B0
MTTVQTPPREGLEQRAAELVPLLRKNALWSEENRRLHPETVEALADAGIFRMRIPARYGGYECDTRTLTRVAAELGRGDASVGWTASVWWIPGWMVGMFPDEVQDEVYATPDVRVCGTLSPSATAVATDGGYVVNGKWGFISGAHHSHWQEILAVAPGPDGEPEPIMALVPMSDLRMVDDWHTSGLRGSGSVSTVAEDLFVPRERVLTMGAIMTQQYASVLNATIPMYRLPLMPVTAASSVGNVIGIAKGALEAFLERLPGRKITYTDYTSQRDAPVTHLQVAEAALKIDEAEFHGHRIAELADAKAAAAAPWTTEERALSRVSMGVVCKRATEAVDILNSASGGTSIYSHVPIQRITRDLHALTQHALATPHVSFETYGRVLCGLAPNTTYF